MNALEFETIALKDETITNKNPILQSISNTDKPGIIVGKEDDKYLVHLSKNRKINFNKK